MRTIVFNFSPDVSSETQHEILQKIEELPGVLKAVPLKPETKVREIQRMCYAHLADEANRDLILKKLRETPEIESAEVPAERYAD